MAQHALHILDATGDTDVMFDPALEAEVESAFDAFGAAAKGKYLAYAQWDGKDKDGAPGWEVIHEFDPTATLTMMRPQMQGG